MRIVLPFSFIYFYTVKNGRFLSHFLSVKSTELHIVSHPFIGTFFWEKFKFINLLFYFSVKINPQFGIFSRIVILYL